MLMTTDLHESKCMSPGVSVDEVDLWIGCCTQMPKKAQTFCGAGNSVGIQCRLFSEFLANGSCRLEYSSQTSGILLFVVS